MKDRGRPNAVLDLVHTRMITTQWRNKLLHLAMGRINVRIIMYVCTARPEHCLLQLASVTYIVRSYYPTLLPRSTIILNPLLISFLSCDSGHPHTNVSDG